MNIRQQLVQLSEIGILDGEIRDFKEKEKALPAKANAAKAKAQELSKRLTGLESKHTAILLKRRQLDLDLQNERNNLRKWESRADQIRGDREYAALMSEIGGLKRTISNLETQIIEDMQEVEDIEKEIVQVKTRSQTAEAQAAEEYSQVSVELAELTQAITTRQNARALLMSTLPGSVVRRYEAVAAQRAGVGVAVVIKEVCQGCRRTIPAELFNRISKAEVLEQCPNCQRFLVTEELSHVQADTN
jgi:predicted  nucleic acid-binding Zn-ribbon protein